ncbi:MAG TPA: MSMEG_1061 family FMN-dependent PPOX-type flavoprotein [Acidimicrobiales bacterium]|nr:MSMEG_1061 family FMN-dependent PPOX-type flavoprotein [Acidimicrobiales bacterium]
MRLSSVDDLRSNYRQPSQRAVDKVIDRLDEHCVDFIAKSPFLLLSTANADGACHGSPKGGPPGFAQVLDEHRLAWADFSGNNRLDSFQDLVTNANVAVLFLIPGLDETLRVNGTAALVTDPELCQQLAIGGKAARVVVVLTVGEVYVHCAKALRRAGLWSPGSWLDPKDLPSAACMLKDHAALDADPVAIQVSLEQGLQSTLWEPGGADPPSPA